MDDALAALADGDTVVTANNRLARAIALAHNRRQQAAGRIAWPSPAVLSWPEWLAGLHAESVAAGGAAGERRLLDEFQLGLAWAGIVRADPPEAGSTPALTDAAAAAWRLCARWRVSAAELARAADSPDSRHFARWAAAWCERRDAGGLTDPDHVTALLATDVLAGRIAVPPVLHFAGFEDWTPVQREFLRVIAGAGCRVVEGVAPKTGRTAICRVPVRDADAELELAARWARGLVAENGAARVGIVVPDLGARRTAVRRAVLDVFAPGWQLEPAREWPVNVSLASPLADTGLVRTALLVLATLTGELDWRDAGLLLRSPWLPGAAAEAAARASLDLALRDRVGTRVGVAAIVEATVAAGAPLLGARLGAIAALAATIPRRQSAAGWAGTFRAALQAAGWPGDRALASDEHQALESWGRLWGALAACDGVAGTLSLDGALALVGRLAGERLFQPAGHPDGVQVLGALEAVGLQFDALWICGLTSDDWPPAARPSAFLPLALQRERGMSDSSPPLARERSERLLRWLEAGAANVVLSTPAFDGSQQLLPSPLVATVPVIEVQALPAWGGPLALDVVAATGPAVRVPLDPPPPLPAGASVRGGIAVLEREASCPARAFVEFRLGARELRSPVQGIDGGRRGKVVHEVLERFYGRVRDHAALCALAPADEEALVAGLVEAALARHLPLGDPLVRRLAALERRRVVAIVREFLAIERTRAGFAVRWAEEAPATGLLPPAVARLGIGLRPDRVDELPDGRFLVVDYKTGRKPPRLADTWGSRPRAPQLALYATAFEADGVAFAHLAAGGITWAGVGTGSWDIGGMVEPAKLTKGESADWDALRESWWAGLDGLAAEFAAGCFDIDRWRRGEASGQWALATRAYELAVEDEEEEA